LVRKKISLSCIDLLPIQLCAEKSGLVKEEAFFTILKLHSIVLTDAEKNRLKKVHTRAGKINYLEALQAISVDLDAAVLNEEKWTVPV